MIAALINGVSQYPRHEGRFPQVAGVKFAFDPSEPPPRRVDARYVWIQGEPLDLKRVRAESDVRSAHYPQRD